MIVDNDKNQFEHELVKTIREYYYHDQKIRILRESAYNDMKRIAERSYKYVEIKEPDQESKILIGIIDKFFDKKDILTRRGFEYFKDQAEKQVKK